MRALVIVVLLLFSACANDEVDVTKVFNKTAKDNFSRGYREGYKKASVKIRDKYENEFQQQQTKYHSIIIDIKKQLVNSKRTDSASALYNKSNIYNYLHSIMFYYNQDDLNSQNNFTLGSMLLGSSIAFNFPLKDNFYSKLVEEYLTDINRERKLFIGTKIDKSQFCFSKIIPIDSTYSLGVLIEYNGFERIYYSYALLESHMEYFKFISLFNKLDAASIGEIKYGKIYKISDDEFYVIGHNVGETYESLALHYFPKDYCNKTYILNDCSPGSFGESHYEKLDFDYDYSNETVLIKKYGLDKDVDNEWHLVEELTYNLKEIVKSLRITS